MAMHSGALTRRRLLKGFAFGALSTVTLAACQPQVVEVEKIVRETVEVEKEVEKVVKETVVVEKVATAVPAEGGIIELRHLLRAGDLGARYDTKLQQFSQDHPNLKAVIEPIPGGDVEYVPKVMAMHAAGTIGDSCWTSIGSVNHFQYADMGITIPLDDLIESSGFDSSPFYPGSWESSKYLGQVYGLPENAHPGAAFLVYNQTLFEQEGVDPPNENWTLDHLLETAKHFTRDSRGDGRIDMWGFNPSLGRLVVMLVRCFSGYEYDVINPEGTTATINQPKTKEALRWVTSLYQEHKVAPTPAALEMGFNQLFMAGKVAMFQTGCWGGPGLTNAMKAQRDFPMEWWVAPLPKGPSGVMGSHAEADCMCVTSQSKYKQEAFELITYFVDMEAGVLRGIEYGCAGAREDQYQDERLRGTLFTHDDVALFDIYNRVNATAGPYFYPANLQGQEAFSVYDMALQPLWLGEAEPTDAFFDEANRQVQTVLDKPKAGA